MSHFQPNIHVATIPAEAEAAEDVSSLPIADELRIIFRCQKYL